MMSEIPGSWGSGQASGPQVEWRTTMRPASRVHQLAKLDRLGLLALYLRKQDGNRAGDLADAAAAWDRDRLITAIRDLEDPR